ncbi:MAG: AMP-binding protein [Syntrophorhabdales bacterium]|jgi:acyl-CoA synthetase (AMP-forming)/AMP-acid ligase II
MFGTTVDALRKHVDRSPQKEFLVGPQGSLTYEKYNKEVNKLANWLAKKGIRKSDNVGLLMFNCFELYTSMLAVHKLGAIANLWNFRLRTKEIGYLAEHVKAKAIIFNYDFLKNLTLDAERIFVCVEAMEELPKGVHAFTETSESPDIEPVGSTPEETDIASVIYTSGTTGYPKGAAYTHTTQLYSAIQYCLEMGLTRGSRGMSAAPVIHGVATNFFFAYLFIGGTFVDTGKYLAEQALQQIAEYKPSELLMVPTQIIEMLNKAEQKKLSKDMFRSLRLIRSGGSPYPISMVHGIHNVFGCHFLNTFGMTENCANVTTMHSGFDPEDSWTTIGKSSYFWNVRVIEISETEGKASAQITPPGRGQLIVKGPQNISQFYMSEKKPDLDDGWLFARDVVDVNGSGWMQIVDRVDQTILSGGENIYPQEVESFLRKHPLIEDVAVIGVPDMKWGEKVVALVVRKSNELQEEDIEKFCLEHEELARYKRPRKVVFVEELSKNVLGKLERAKLKEQYRHLGESA